MRLLVTGGTGYIGSHTTIELIAAGHDVTIVDNLANSKRAVLTRLERITGADIPFHQLDLNDGPGLDQLLTARAFDGVVHFAGLKSVAESTRVPLAYYETNVAGTRNLLAAMAGTSTRLLVFSSSATVYGETFEPPFQETLPVGSHLPVNPYGRTKVIVENMLTDLCRSDRSWKVALLRYFNPVGAHETGLIGEDPDGVPNNLFPFLTQVAVGRRERLTVFGNDYPTADGTPLRDYVHVMDLARGHLAALERLESAPGVLTYNLGTGQGLSVLQVINAFERVNGIRIPYEIGERRPGDLAVSYADPGLAERELGWTTEYELDDFCRDSFRWQTLNPKGYQ